ncbi:hypothetical protein ACIO53_34095 [Streptomyces sp. NPDC087305]|uniref:hypothetical protein n=1 Tax=Streptomyces sp. NPDC087305 TaxID=3365781 RepID=UPI0038059C3E
MTCYQLGEWPRLVYAIREPSAAAGRHLAGRHPTAPKRAPARRPPLRATSCDRPTLAAMIGKVGPLTGPGGGE